MEILTAVVGEVGVGGLAEIASNAVDRVSSVARVTMLKPVHRQRSDPPGFTLPFPPSQEEKKKQLAIKTCDIRLGAWCYRSCLGTHTQNALGIERKAPLGNSIALLSCSTLVCYR
jgi:hypothetical protein